MSLREIFGQLMCDGGRAPSPRLVADIDQREIFFTPFEGAYGCAGWIAVLNGSPPYGCLVVCEGTSSSPDIVYIHGDRSRRLNPHQRVFGDVLREIASATCGRNEAFVVAPVARTTFNE